MNLKINENHIKINRIVRIKHINKDEINVKWKIIYIQYIIL
jgi:hypothetical protein